jgi:FtsZ-interacting cell division protein ZipA
MTTLRNCLVISVAIHVVIMLWLALGPGVRTFGPASADPILVDLVAPQDVPKGEAAKTETQEAKTEQPKAEEPQGEKPKSEPPAARKPEPKTAPPKSGSPKPDPSKTVVDANQPPPQNDFYGDVKTAQDSAEERAATAARLAWMLNLPTDTATSLAAPPSEEKSNLAREEVAAFKTQVSRCWVAPAGMPNTPDATVLMRIALNPNGTLGAAPELIAAPASIDGNPLKESAKRALQKCQPYTALPAAKYQDWKILDMSFTPQGPGGLVSLPGVPATH